MKEGIELEKRLKDLVDFSILPNDLRRALERLPKDGEQALIEMYDENSEFHKYAHPVNIAKDFLIEDNTELYHYTSYDNLASIVTGKKFWIKSKSYMNDPKEFSYTYELSESLLKELGASDSEISDFKSIIQGVKFDIYLWSFSENEASQALWGNYGNKKGVALKMNTKVLMEELGTHFSNGKDNLMDYTVGSAYVFPLKVLYNQEEQKKRLSVVLVQWLRSSRNMQFDPPDMEEIMNNCLNALLLYAVMLKNPLLYQEEEGRFIILNITDGNQVAPEFYVDDVPFVSCGLMGRMLSEVIIQTGSDVEYSVVNSLLSSNGFENVRITNSILPY
ncbi:TPA: DUF2971 domain-containing protein [Listeria monocytogenes]